MRITINTIPLLAPLTGIGSYIYQIAKTLNRIDAANEYEYYYGYYSKKLIKFSEGDRDTFFKLKELVKKIPGAGFAARKVKQHLAQIKFGRSDVYFEPNYVPLNIKAKKIVVTVADFSFKVHPEWHPKERMQYFNTNFDKNIGRADRIIFISDYIRDCAIKYYGFPKEKLTTIHLGFDTESFRKYDKAELEICRKKYGLPENFILSVGSLEPRKNLKSLIQAYMGLEKAVRSGHKLVLAGFSGWNNAELMSLLEKIKGDVVYLGYVPVSDLGMLYNVASVFVYPSLYEGFGLPPLEAMACGCPVVVSNVTSLPEVCGEAACYVDPLDVNSIAAGIARVLGDDAYRKALIRQGLERAGHFSWERSAREHLRVFEEVAAG